MPTQETKFNAIKEAIGFDKMTKKDQTEFLLEMNDLLFHNTITSVLELMDDKTKEAFHTLVDSKASTEEIYEFIEHTVPAVHEITAEIVRELTNDILTVVGK
jgi:hypothetical protein